MMHFSSNTLTVLCKVRLNFKHQTQGNCINWTLRRVCVVVVVARQNVLLLHTHTRLFQMKALFSCLDGIRIRSSFPSCQIIRDLIETMKKNQRIIFFGVFCNSTELKWEIFALHTHPYTFSLCLFDQGESGGSLWFPVGFPIRFSYVLVGNVLVSQTKKKNKNPEAHAFDHSMFWLALPFSFLQTRLLPCRSAHHKRLTQQLYLVFVALIRHLTWLQFKLLLGTTRFRWWENWLKHSKSIQMCEQKKWESLWNKCWGSNVQHPIVGKEIGSMVYINCLFKLRLYAYMIDMRLRINIS